MKVSLIIPVYYNEENLKPLYVDLKVKFIEKIDYDYEIIFVDDGSKDKSYLVMQEIAEGDPNIRIVKLSRNFGSHAACLCGMTYATGDCVVIKAADLQEPTELIIDMVDSWKCGNNIVLACRRSREEKKHQVRCANFYYWFVRKTALPSMPENGFDIYLLDKKVINVIQSFDEKNSAITGQILWSGFKTGIVYYDRKERKIGTSRWTFKKKIKLVLDTLFSFSTLPIRVFEMIGITSLIVAIVWSCFVLIERIMGNISAVGFTTLFIFNLFEFGIIMASMGVLGEYIWRTFDASRKRPPFIVEDSNYDAKD